MKVIDNGRAVWPAHFVLTSELFFCIIPMDILEKVVRIMAGMIEFDEFKVRLNGMKPGLDDLRDALALDAARNELVRLHGQIASEEFLDNNVRAKRVQ